MVPGAGIEPARCCHRGILSPLRLPISPSGHNAAMRLTFGGWGRNRTGVNGVAVRCMTTLPPSHLVNQRRLNYSNIRNILHVFIASSLVVIPFSTKNLSAKNLSKSSLPSAQRILLMKLSSPSEIHLLNYRLQYKPIKSAL